MRQLRRFFRFWYDFVVGDDWQVAVGVVIGLGLTAVLAALDIAAWWLMPLAAIVLLAVSTWRKAAS
jgi:hypothetical protein